MDGQRTNAPGLLKPMEVGSTLKSNPNIKPAKNSPPAAPDFAPADLATFEAGIEAPGPLISATSALTRLATAEVDGSGRFADSFTGFSRTAAETRAALRLCQAALDFLETEFLREEAAQLQFLRDEAAKFEALRAGEAPCSA